MAQKTFLVLLLSFCSISGFSQGLQNFDYYYAHPAVSQDAKEYYARLFNINSSNKTYSIMDSVYTNNDDTRPFYVYLVCRMLKEAEGGLLTELNIVCRQIAELYPSTLIPVLYAGKNYVDEDIKDLWASRMSVEVRITCNNDLMSCFKKSRRLALQNCESRYKGKLEILYNTVRKDLNLFQQR